MLVPGLPLTVVNKEFEKQTGFSREEAEGHNCRMLQGPDTEQEQVAAIISALQTASPLELELTNYRKSGESFRNLFSLKPVHDTEGVYRFTIGVQYDVSVHGQKRVAEMRELVQALPSSFAASLQVAQLTESPPDVVHQQQKRQQKQALRQFTKMAWLSDPDLALTRLMQREEAVACFSEFLSMEYMEGQLQLWLEACKLDNMDADAQKAEARQLFEDYLKPTGKSIARGDGVVKQVQEEAARARQMLVYDSFPRFIQSSHVQQVLDVVVGDGSGAVAARPDLLWRKYRVPSDAAEWLYTFVGAADTFPACIVISDMSIPGNPMFYVNEEFCRVTQYAKEEAQGRNCRFLQGPATEPASVAVIQDTLRRGVDCHVRLTNYRKDGSSFQNLLSMRPVHDTNNVYRFCIGVQFEVGKSANLKERLKKLDTLLQMLPARLDVGQTKRKGRRTHMRRAVPENVSRSTTELLAGALQKTAPVQGTDITSAARFAKNREVMLQDISAICAGGQPNTRSVRFAES